MIMAPSKFSIISIYHMLTAVWTGHQHDTHHAKGSIPNPERPESIFNSLAVLIITIDYV